MGGVGAGLARGRRPGGVRAVDRDAVGVSNLDQHTTTNYNPKAEFWSNWFKATTGIFTDENENFIVFFAA